MATPNEKIAESLIKLKELQDSNIVAIKASDLTRVHRERLLKNGFIREVVRGWYVSVPHDEVIGDSTSWFTSFWEFCYGYLTDRYGEDYCISAEQSLAFHAGNTTVPRQLIIRSTKGNNLPTELLFGTSIFVMKSLLPKHVELENINGLRGVSLPSSIVYSTPSVFRNQAIDMRNALFRIRDASELLGILLDGGHSKIAGRLAGAFRNIGRDRVADEILSAMKMVDYDVREVDPFDTKSPISFEPRETSPFVNRIKLMWYEMRDKVISIFPKPPGIPKDVKKYMEEIDEIYVTDAYHSLSIERYQVTPGLIEKVRSGEWNTEGSDEDKKQKDAMAARGYWLAFNEVKKSLERIFSLENPGKVIDEEHGGWYQQLFAPSVAVGLLKPSDLAGYRNAQVYISQSMHTPVDRDAVRDTMPALFELLKQEKDPGVRAVLGHFIFVYIHPYMDGNGRIARFLMNSMLISGGYPWTVIPVEQRDQYMKSLESASVGQDILPFAKYIAYLVTEGLKGKPIAKVT